MNSSVKHSDKAQEIAYALIRLAAYVRRKDFRSRLENLALMLVESASVTEPDAALATSASIQNIVKLLASVYEIETVNARILLGELVKFDSAMRQSFGIDVLPDISSLFSSGNAANSSASLPTGQAGSLQDGVAELPYSSDSAMDISDEMKETRVDVDEGISAESVQHEKPQSNIVSVGSAIRQSAILDKIKVACSDVGVGVMSKGCRMKDLIAEFPDVSERTLRYDLQRLLQHGSVQRVGNGGPASYYVIK